MPARQAADEHYNMADFEMIDLERDGDGDGDSAPPPYPASSAHGVDASAAGLSHHATAPPAGGVAIRMSRGGCGGRSVWRNHNYGIMLIVLLAVAAALVFPAALYVATHRGGN